MAATISTVEPVKFAAGDTVVWQKSLADYSAADGWVLSYAFVNADGAFSESTSVASGSEHLVTITASDSAALAAGTYQWQAYVTLSGARYQVGAGTCTVEPNFATGAVDARSHVKKVLDAIESVIAGRASEDASSLSVAGRSITKMSLDELISARDKYKAEYAKEIKAERIAAGLGHRGKVRVRFVN